MTKKEEIEIRIPMKNLCAKLPKEDFVQTHKSYIVALQAIWKIEETRSFYKISVHGYLYREGK